MFSLYGSEFSEVSYVWYCHISFLLNFDSILNYFENQTKEKLILDNL